MSTMLGAIPTQHKVAVSTGVVSPKYAAINVSSAGYNSIISAVTGRRIIVLQYALTVGGSVTVTWESSGGTAHSGPMPLTAGIAVPFNPTGHFKGVRGEGMGVFLSAPVAVGGHLQYVEE